MFRKVEGVNMGSLSRMVVWNRYLIGLWGLLLLPVLAVGQDAKSGMQYPIDLEIAPDGSIVVVDLNLPGLWRIPQEGGTPTLIYQGTKLLRKPMNRPRCVAVMEDGNILVGDTATREIYRIAADGSGEPQPLTSGFLGIPNSLSLDGKGRLYIADLETRFVYGVAEAGGQPELFSKTSVRGLHHGPDGTLWGVTPSADALVKFSEAGEATAIVGERPFQFPHNAVVDSEGNAYVTDGYAKGIWKIAAGGKPESFFSGAPLQNPVGLAHVNGKLFIADPHAKQIFALDMASKEIQPLVAEAQ